MLYIYSYVLTVHEVVGMCMDMRLVHVQMVGFVPKGFVETLI